MRRYTRQALILFGILLAVLLIAWLLAGNTRRISIPIESRSVMVSPPVLQIENPDVIRLENIDMRNQTVEFDVVPLKRGYSAILLTSPDGEILEDRYLAVSRFGLIYDEETGAFQGDLLVMFCITAFLLLTGAMALRGFLQAKGPSFYAYSTIFYIGFFIFSLFMGIMMLNLTLRHLVAPDRFVMRSVYRFLISAPARFLELSAPVLGIFAVAMAVSNIALLRHNRPRIQNVLGLMISFLILGGALLGYWLTNRDFSGSLLEYRLNATVENVYCTIYVFFECILIGAMICGFKAALHQPPADRGIIIILGCWFRPDGTLPPLLRGRVDRAIEYWRKHREQTGREAILIPSGGQGFDEPMPEAAAMKLYLLEHGIPERVILTETRSINTFQNLAFSSQVMKENGLSGEVIFSTTNYHVFRSGLWAGKAGLNAEGIGSRTIWWFWPNAFIRECVGLVANRWKQELLLLGALILFFGLLSMTILT